MASGQNSRLEHFALRVTCQHFSPAIYQIKHMVNDSMLIFDHKTSLMRAADRNGLTRKPKIAAICFQLSLAVAEPG